jgi:hypothetical protein
LENVSDDGTNDRELNWKDAKRRVFVRESCKVESGCIPSSISMSRRRSNRKEEEGGRGSTRTQRRKYEATGSAMGAAALETEAVAENMQFVATGKMRNLVEKRKRKEEEDEEGGGGGGGGIFTRKENMHRGHSADF